MLIANLEPEGVQESFHWTKGKQTFTAEVTVSAKAGWQTVSLRGDQFIEAKTSQLLGDSINEAGVIELVSQKKSGWSDPKVMFRNFQWVGGKYVPHYHSYRAGGTTANTEDFSSDDARHLQDHEAIKD